MLVLNKMSNLKLDFTADRDIYLYVEERKTIGSFPCVSQNWIVSRLNRQIFKAQQSHFTAVWKLIVISFAQVFLLFLPCTSVFKENFKR